MSQTVAFIGSNGHMGYALDPLLESSEPVRFVFAPASTDDSMQGMVDLCLRKGKEAVSYDDWKVLLEKEKVDVAVNCSVCGYMEKISEAFLRSGSHVFCEKPLARTLEELESLEKARKESGKVLLAMLPMRFEEGFRSALDAVRKGVIGKVRLVNAQKSYKLGTRADFFKNRSVYGGTIPWVGAHAIDFILFMSGEKILSVASLNSSLYNRNHGDLDVSCACLFSMTGEVIATASIDYFRPEKAPTHGDDRVRVVGTEGILEVKGGKCYLTKDGTEELPDVSVISIFDDFVRQTKGLPPTLLSPEESIENARACLLARDAAEEKSIRESQD